MARKNPAAVALGRKGGKVRSEAKTDAARANGRKGGRPRFRTCAHSYCTQPAQSGTDRCAGHAVMPCGCPVGGPCECDPLGERLAIEGEP